MLFSADQMSSQNNHQEDYKSGLNASSGLWKCFPQHLPQTPVFEENFLIFALQLCLTFQLISYWSSPPTYFQKMHTLCKQNLFMLDLLRYKRSELCDEQRWVTVYHIFFPTPVVFFFNHTSRCKIGKKVHTYNRKQRSYSFPHSYGIVYIRILFFSPCLILYNNHSSYTRWLKSLSKLSWFIWT